MADNREPTVAPLDSSAFFGPAETPHILPLAVLLPIMDAIEARERYPRSRVRNIAMYAVSLVRALNCPSETIEEIRLGALLCNLGMLRVPEAILDKTTQLTPDEQARIRHHPVYGAELLADIPELVRIAPIVRHHHEDWSGNGYPLGLHGDQIPLGARIVRICETYDALTCERPYRAAYPLGEALKTIAAGTNRQFDPRIVYAFKQMMQQQPQRDEVLDRWDGVQTTGKGWRVVAATTTSLRR